MRKKLPFRARLSFGIMACGPTLVFGYWLTDWEVWHWLPWTLYGLAIWANLLGALGEYVRANQ